MPQKRVTGSNADPQEESQEQDPVRRDQKRDDGDGTDLDTEAVSTQRQLHWIGEWVDVYQDPPSDSW